MNVEQTVVGIISPAAEMRALLRIHLLAASFSSFVEGNQYCVSREDGATKRMVEAQPKIILVDMQDAQAALQTLRILHEQLPQTWLLVSSASEDSRLIIESMRAGAREFLPNPVTLESLTGALARYRAEQKKAVEKRLSGKVYSITAAKGGAGTTSVAINLAASLATARNVKVALIDLGSPMGDAAEYLNLKSEFSVADALAAAQRLDPVLLESYTSQTHGVAVLPGIKEFRPGLMNPAAMAQMLQVASETYTHAFIDIFCSHDEEQLEVVTRFSAAVIVVLTPELPALWRTDRLIRLLERARCGDKIRLVLNRNSKRFDISGKKIEKMLKRPIFWRLPNNYPAAMQAVNSGKPLVAVNHSALASNYFQLAQALTGVTVRQQRRGVLGLFS